MFTFPNLLSRFINSVKQTTLESSIPLWLYNQKLIFFMGLCLENEICSNYNGFSSYMRISISVISNNFVGFFCLVDVCSYGSNGRPRRCSESQSLARKTIRLWLHVWWWSISGIIPRKLNNNIFIICLYTFILYVTYHQMQWW